MDQGEQVAARPRELGDERQIRVVLCDDQSRLFASLPNALPGNPGGQQRQHFNMGTEGTCHFWRV